jgi:hypothetical protein
MGELTIDKRVDISRFDKKTIQSISSQLVKLLSDVAESAPETSGRLFYKCVYQRAGYSKGHHYKVIVGEPETDQVADPDSGRQP